MNEEGITSIEHGNATVSDAVLESVDGHNMCSKSGLVPNAWRRTSAGSEGDPAGDHGSNRVVLRAIRRGEVKIQRAVLMPALWMMMDWAK